jgi:uncharacterized protein (DUF305 family)
MKKTIALAGLMLLGIAGIAGAQQGHHGHHGNAPPAAAATETPSTKAFRAVNDKMHADMDLKFSGDADVDFLRGMIPHHQGAIDMAKVVLEHGKDARVRKLAEEIIRAQEAEIAQMQKWLKEMGR